MDSDAKDDLTRYNDYMVQHWLTWEAACRRCGACCGLAEGDPCEELGVDPQGRTFCRIYKNRFAGHRTRAGREFQCVPIRNILHTSWVGCSQCAYKQ